MKRIIVLGATGSLGGSFLNALRGIPSMRVIGLSCDKNTEKLGHLAIEFGAEAVANTKNSVDGPWDQFTGVEAPVWMIQALRPDIVINAISGINGLEPAMAALRNHADLIMGCKEALVAAGPLLKKTALKYNTRIIPADSEHVATQLLLNDADGKIEKLILTGTGGALRDMPVAQWHNASIDQVMTHPVWQMGPKITVDSATLMNKALEVIEAAWLFDLPVEKIETRINRSGTIHAALRLSDGRIMIHEAKPSMQAVANLILTGRPWGRIVTGKKADLMMHGMTAVVPDSCADLGHLALKEGGDASAILVGADQAVVEAFLEKKLEFGNIRDILLESLTFSSKESPDSIDKVMRAFFVGYTFARLLIKR